MLIGFSLVKNIGPHRSLKLGLDLYADSTVGLRPFDKVLNVVFFSHFPSLNNRHIRQE